MPGFEIKFSVSANCLDGQHNIFHAFNPLPNDKIWDVTKLKAFADDKLIFDKMTISLFYRAENSFFHCFQKPTSFRTLKVWIVW